jgi:hypothetical protein
MSLNYAQIESLLFQGISFRTGGREFIAKANPKDDTVLIHEQTALTRSTVPLEYVVDQAHANESGSDLADAAALRRLLAELATGAV